MRAIERAALDRLPHICGCTPKAPCPKGARLFHQGRSLELRGHLERTLNPKALPPPARRQRRTQLSPIIGYLELEEGPGR